MGNAVAWVVAVSGARQGEEFDVGAEPILVGRSRSCRIQLEDGTVSGRHCQLSWNGEEIELLDLGSTRGVYVNGVLAARARLAHGDRFDVGDTTFEAHIEPG